jgi:hypothetical protein
VDSKTLLEIDISICLQERASVNTSVEDKNSKIEFMRSVGRENNGPICMYGLAATVSVRAQECVPNNACTTLRASTRLSQPVFLEFTNDCSVRVRSFKRFDTACIASNAVSAVLIESTISFLTSCGLTCGGNLRRHATEDCFLALASALATHSELVELKANKQMAALSPFTVANRKRRESEAVTCSVDLPSVG